MAKSPKGVVIEYENTEAIKPSYVEAAQGMLTPHKALHVSFYSEYIKPKSTLKSDEIVDVDSNTIKVKSDSLDPYGLGSEETIHIVRRVEASVVFNERVLEELIVWLQQKLKEMKNT